MFWLFSNFFFWSLINSFVAIFMLQFKVGRMILDKIKPEI